MLGLELRDHSALAVVADEQGRVLGRGEAADADVRVAAFAAPDLRRRPWRAGRRHGVGVAAHNPGVARVPRGGGGVLRCATASARAGGVLARGTAAQVEAEAWIGAARGARRRLLSRCKMTTRVGRHSPRRRAEWRDAVPRAPAVAWLALNPVEREDYRKERPLPWK